MSEKSGKCIEEREASPSCSPSKVIVDDSETDENEEEIGKINEKEMEEGEEAGGEEEEEEKEKEEEEEEDCKEKVDKERSAQIEKSTNHSQTNTRRGSRGNIFGKVGISPSLPSRSLSFNSTRDKIKTQEHRGIPPKSPPLSTKRSKSPQPSHPNSPLVGRSPLQRRSIGVPDSKLVVLGVPCVGKSAVVVRLLTGRFIWEYDPTLEAVYRYHTTIDDDPATLEILDTAGLVDGRVNEGHVRWGDGFLIVYSLTDRNSFLAVPDIHASIASLKHTPNFPCVLLANKSDLVHSSKVCEEEASIQASELGISFFSVSACEGSPALSEAFTELHRDVVRRFRNRRRRSSAKVVIEGFYKMFSR